MLRLIFGPKPAIDNLMICEHDDDRPQHTYYINDVIP